MDRIDFENSIPVERSERIHEAERVRGDKRRQRPERQRRAKKRDRKHDGAEGDEKPAREKVGKNLDIEA